MQNTYSYYWAKMGRLIKLSSHMDRNDSSVDRALHRYHKVMGSNPVQAWIFSGCFFNCLSWEHTARITNFTHYKNCKINRSSINIKINVYLLFLTLGSIESISFSRCFCNFTLAISSWIIYYVMFCFLL